MTGVLQIDSREARMHATTVAILRRQLGEDLVQIDELLQFGDYVFTSDQPHPTTGQPVRVAIELATVSDLVGKIESGRFGYQLSGMIENYDRAILMICGPIIGDSAGHIRGLGPKKFTYERVASALFSASCHGVIVQHAQSADSDHVAARVLSNYRFWHKSADEHKTFHKFPELVDHQAIGLSAALDRRLAVIMGVPKIGEDRARALLAEAGSLASAFLMTPEDLQKIDGWGKKLSQDFNDFAWRTTP